MFRQHIYKEDEDNLLFNRLNEIHTNGITFNKIRFWDITHKGWVDCDNLTGYKIHKEIKMDGQLIFYIYLEDDIQE